MAKELPSLAPTGFSQTHMQVGHVWNEEMLDAYIIDAIKQEERRRREEAEEGRRLHLELPVVHHRRPEVGPEMGEDPYRGSLVIPLESEIPLRDEDAA